MCCYLETSFFHGRRCSAEKRRGTGVKRGRERRRDGRREARLHVLPASITTDDPRVNDLSRCTWLRNVHERHVNGGIFNAPSTRSRLFMCLNCDLELELMRAERRRVVSPGIFIRSSFSLCARTPPHSRGVSPFLFTRSSGPAKSRCIGERAR